MQFFINSVNIIFQDYISLQMVVMKWHSRSAAQVLGRWDLMLSPLIYIVTVSD